MGFSNRKYRVLFAFYKTPQPLSTVGTAEGQ